MPVFPLRRLLVLDAINLTRSLQPIPGQLCLLPKLVLREIRLLLSECFRLRRGSAQLLISLYPRQRRRCSFWQLARRPLRALFLDYLLELQGWGQGRGRDR
jgi:hypothetical protein